MERGAGGRKHKPIRPPTPSDDRGGGTKRSVFTRLGSRDQESRLPTRVLKKHQSEEKRQEVCRNHMRGACPYGSHCLYLHPPRPPTHERDSSRGRYQDPQTSEFRNPAHQSRNQHQKRKIVEETPGQRPKSRKRKDWKVRKGRDQQQKTDLDEAQQLERRRQEIKRQLQQLDQEAPTEKQAPDGGAEAVGSSASEGEASSSSSSSSSTGSSSSSDDSSDDEMESRKVAVGDLNTIEKSGSDLERAQQQILPPPPEPPNLAVMEAATEQERRPSLTASRTREPRHIPSSVIASAVVRPPDRKPPQVSREWEQFGHRRDWPGSETERGVGRRRPERNPPPSVEHGDYRPHESGTLPSLLDIKIPHPRVYEKKEDRRDYKKGDLRYLSKSETAGALSSSGKGSEPYYGQRKIPGRKRGESRECDRYSGLPDRSDRRNWGPEIPGIGIRRTDEDRRKEYLRTVDDRVENEPIGFDKGRRRLGEEKRTEPPPPLPPRGFVERGHHVIGRDGARPRRSVDFGRVREEVVGESWKNERSRAGRDRLGRREPPTEALVEDRARPPSTTGSQLSERKRKRPDVDRDGKWAKQEPVDRYPTLLRPKLPLPDRPPKGAQKPREPKKDVSSPPPHRRPEFSSKGPRSAFDVAATKTIPANATVKKEIIDEDYEKQHWKSAVDASKKEEADELEAAAMADVRLEEISDDEIEEVVAESESQRPTETGSPDVLTVDWASLLETEKPAMEPSAIRDRFRPRNFLRSLPLSKKYLGEELASEIATLCNQPLEEGATGPTDEFRFLGETATEHLAETNWRKTRPGLFSPSSCGSALSARADLSIRRRLCGFRVDVENRSFASDPGLSFSPSLLKTAKQLFLKNSKEKNCL